MDQPREPRPSEVIFQVYPASFNDSDGDGHGDIRGIIQKLDYIKGFGDGVDTIWIAPFYLSPPGPEGDGGYAVTDYRMIDPRFGTMDDFKELLKEAHARGIKIYTDLVIAHTAHDHEWFEKSRRREEPYTDHYVWHSGSTWDGKRVPPNNWKSVFGGEAWTYDEKRDQYYLHHFLKSQPALNLNNEKVQDAILAETKFWLDLGIDGIRIDAIPFATHDPQFRNNPWLYGSWPNVHENWDQQRFDHSICQPQTVGLITRIRKLMDSYPDKKTTLGEVTCGPDGGGNCLPIASSYIDRDKGLDMCYTYVANGISQQMGADALKNLLRQIEHHFPDGGHCLSISNHDSWRTFARIEKNVPEAQCTAAGKQLMQLFFSMQSSIVLYQGEELALPQARIPEDIPYDKLKDPVAQTYGPGACRDGSRTPMPWEAGKKNAGFSTADEPYLPVPQSHYGKAVDLQEVDPESMLNFMRRLAQWRKNQPALVQGITTVLETQHPVLAFLRRSRDQTMLCVFNLSPGKTAFTPSDVLDEKTLKELSLRNGQVLSLEGYGTHFSGARLGKQEPAPKARPQNRPPL